jgi:hypothetical protein
VFAVKVPADFGDKQKVVWTVKMQGKSFEIPGACERSGRSTRWKARRAPTTRLPC